jgi:hypothetical protein
MDWCPVQERRSPGPMQPSTIACLCRYRHLVDSAAEAIHALCGAAERIQAPRRLPSWPAFDPAGAAFSNSTPIRDTTLRSQSLAVQDGVKMATILIVSATGPADVTRASIPFHIGVNGVAASGNRCGIALAGDATDLVKDDHRDLRGVGVPPLADLLTGCVEREVDVYV